MLDQTVGVDLNRFREQIFCSLWYCGASGPADLGSNNLAEPVMEAFGRVYESLICIFHFFSCHDQTPL